jgi:thioredoxin reductase/NAD-dependent dihydropyrimidine dehydrogenase PreA subunit
MNTITAFFTGKGAFTYSGEQYPLVDRQGQSNIPGLFVIGDLAGTPDIKAALNGGWRLAQHIAALPRPRLAENQFEVIIIGAGPAGVNAALEFEKLGVSYLVLEKDRLFGALDRFAKTHQFYVASKGDRAVLGDLPFDHDCTAGELVADWKKRLESRRLNARYGEAVTGVQKRDLFEVRTGKSVYLAQRVIVAVGKHVHLRKLEVAGARDPKVRYVWDDSEQFAGKRLLVLCAGHSTLAMEKVCQLSAHNQVMLACDHPPEELEHRATGPVLSRVMQLARDGKIEIIGDVKLKQITETGAVIEQDGAETTVAVDYVLPMTPLEQEVPVAELKRFGLKFENTWDARRVTALLAAVALVAAFYYALRTWGGSVQLGPLNGWNLYAMLYSFVVVGFGVPAMLKWWRNYHDAYQVKRYLSLMTFQVVFFWLLPDLVLKNWMAYGLAYVWPLSLKPHNVAAFIQSKSFYLGWIIFTSAVALPVLVWFKGRKYCTWLCGCGALAETLGSRWRHLSPKGVTNTKREKQIYIVTAVAGIATLLAALGFDHLGGGFTLAGLYSLTVDLWLIAILPIAFYPFFGGKIWCRYWCPVVGWMNLVHKAKPKALPTHGIAANKDRCIACGLCDRYCEVGVPVKTFALRGEFFSVDNSSCIGCGVCITVCPTDVLNYANRQDEQ